MDSTSVTATEGDVTSVTRVDTGVDNLAVTFERLECTATGTSGIQGFVTHTPQANRAALTVLNYSRYPDLQVQANRVIDGAATDRSFALTFICD